MAVDPRPAPPTPEKRSHLTLIVLVAFVAAAVLLSYLPVWLAPFWIAAFLAYFVWNFRRSIAAVYGQRHARSVTPYIIFGLALALAAALTAAFGGSVGALMGWGLWASTVLILLAVITFRSVKRRISSRKR